MAINFAGRVLFANDVSASSVEVRVFDKDAPGKTDDDLTVTPGLSDANGHFTVTYNPGQAQDYTTIQLTGLFSHLFSWSDGPQTISLPDFSDTLQPYLQFRYTFNEQPCVYTAPLATFQYKFQLPETCPLNFVPSQQGFKFVNNFPGYPLPFSVPALPGHPDVTSNYGLCGGMSSSAYDFYLAGKAVPQATTVPDQGSPLQQYLFKRSIDSFGSFGSSVVKVAKWTVLPDDTVNGIWKLTHDEFAQIKAAIDNQRAVLIALVYERAGNPIEIMQKIWDNHQVLAIGYTPRSDGGVDIHIYDPNYPGEDDVVIRAEPVTVDNAGTPGLKCTQWVGEQSSWNVRGFFAMTYVPVEPSDGL